MWPSPWKSSHECQLQKVWPQTTTKDNSFISTYENWKCVNKSTISTISLYFLHVKQCKLRKESYCSSSFHLCHLAFHPASGAKVRTASTTLTRLPQVSNLKPTQAEKKWWTIMEPMNWRSQNHLCLSESHCILTVVVLIVFFDLCGLGTGTYHQRWSHWMGSTTRRRWSSPVTWQKLWGYGDPKGRNMLQNEHTFFRLQLPPESIERLKWWQYLENHRKSGCGELLLPELETTMLLFMILRSNWWFKVAQREDKSSKADKQSCPQKRRLSEQAGVLHHAAGCPNLFRSFTLQYMCKY